jgi:hypothetical protein
VRALLPAIFAGLLVASVAFLLVDRRQRESETTIASWIKTEPDAPIQKMYRIVREYIFVLYVSPMHYDPLSVHSTLDIDVNRVDGEHTCRVVWADCRSDPLIPMVGQPPKVELIKILHLEEPHLVPSGETSRIAFADICKVGGSSQPFGCYIMLSIALHSSANFIFSNDGVDFHYFQLTTHYVDLCSRGGNRGIRLFEGRDSIPVLLIAATAHFDQHAEIGNCENQSDQSKDNSGVRRAATMVASAPPSIWPAKLMPDTPTELTKGVITGAVIVLCAILLWFGVPMIFIGIDQRAFPLLVGGILSIVIQVAASRLRRSRVVCAGIMATSETKSPRWAGPADRTGAAGSPLSKIPSARPPPVAADQLAGDRPGLIRGQEYRDERELRGVHAAPSRRAATNRCWRCDCSAFWRHSNMPRRAVLGSKLRNYAPSAGASSKAAGVNHSSCFFDPSNQTQPTVELPWSRRSV